MSTRTAEAPSLAERLDAARQAEAGPRQRVTEIRAALQAAEERRDWPEVTRLEGELQPAEEALAFASAIVTALDGQRAAIDRERQEREAARLKAEQRERTQEVLAQALEDQRLAGEETDGYLQQALAAIGTVQDALHMAQAAERRVGHAKRRVYEQRVILGEIEAVPGGFGWPTPATALIDSDPVIRSLMKWTGPRHGNRPAPGTASPPAAPRGATQRAPW